MANTEGGGFPRHRAAASLKQTPCRDRPRALPRFSAASGRGLIEAPGGLVPPPGGLRFPRHRAAASLKLLERTHESARRWSFPRHRAAASLKRRRPVAGAPDRRVFRGIGPRPH